MIRMTLECKLYMPSLPIIEIELQLFHNGNIINEINSYKIISDSVELIERIAKECDGNLLSTMPRGKINKDAKMAAFMTVSFVYFEQLEKFERLLKQAFS